MIQKTDQLFETKIKGGNPDAYPVFQNVLLSLTYLLIKTETLEQLVIKSGKYLLDILESYLAVGTNPDYEWFETLHNFIYIASC